MKFCICCGEDVPCNRVERDGNQELTCVHCGFVVGTVEPHPVAAKCIITVDDVASVRELLKGLLINKRLAEMVVTAANGAEFTGLFNARLAAHQPVDLVILDLEMPVMDGVSAARVMRALEDKHHAIRSPILFFSARKCDDALKKQLSLFAPASYVNKGTSTHFDALAERIDQLVTHLLNKKRAPA